MKWSCLIQYSKWHTAGKFYSLNYLLLRQRQRLRTAKYCDEYVCVCLCVCLFVRDREYLRNYTRDRYQIYVDIAYGRGSRVLLRRRCNTLCTFGFVDDIMFL